MKTFYTDYVTHCMRFYTRHTDPTFSTEYDRLNWLACEKAMADFSEEERDILVYVYREADTVADNVYQMAKKLQIRQNHIWKLMSELEKKVARIRGLA